MSYGYDRETGTFYFRLAVTTGSEKGELDDRQATFVTYDQPEDRWQSVVAEGKLEPTSKESIALETLEGLGNVELQYVDIFDQPIESVPFEFYRLVPDRIGARRELRTSR
ncbi:pyridoxamine 5'-phosphate oxidase [Halolamina pelagica]|uniref:Pyridoxamine 5'-phosphate oxidase n=1 Tax=Halolamina pelagica TaxID=699431 RepID=A0A0P7GPG1_9EURY|nr:pyridoxamine 5'-phosphate oxidase family protein [Halolamina pelagica]KPN30840.1 pyridoxamine 5'-phosphate oxidase [Halolamina pelagica]